MRKPATLEQQAKAAERRNQFRQMVKKVADMSEEERQSILARVGAVVTCEGRALSPTNTMLCILQNPKVSMVGGFKQWIKQGRAVMKGQHGIAIWVPIGHKDVKEQTGEQTEPDDVHFIMGTVFDIGQTQEILAEAA